MTVSVFITSYNQKAYLGEAIESVLNQTVPPSEIVVIDDASSDGSQELIQNYARNNRTVRCLTNDRNRGIPYTKGRALGELTGDWCTYVDGDDRWLPGKLEAELQAAERNPGAGIVFSNFQTIDKDGKCLWTWAEAGVPVPEGNILAEVVGRMFPRDILFRCELMRGDLIRERGVYDQRYPTHEDWELRIRMASGTRAVYCPKVLSQYRMHQDNISKTRDLIVRLNTMKQVHRNTKPYWQHLSPHEKRLIEQRLRGLWARFARGAARMALKDVSQTTMRRRLIALRHIRYALLTKPSFQDMWLIMKCFQRGL